MVVSVGGRAHCVPAEVFDLFFATEEKEPKYKPGLTMNADYTEFLKPVPLAPQYLAPELATDPVPKDLLKPLPLSPGLPKVEPPLIDRKAAKPAGLSTSAAIIQAINEGPRTSAELKDRVLDLMGLDAKDPVKRSTVDTTAHYLKGLGKIEKRECPKTTLDKWFLVKQPKA